MSNKITCRDIKGNKVEVDKDQLTFRPSAYGVLIEEGKVLLSPQWDGYDIPGGAMETDETIEQCLEREFFEETGLRVKKKELLICKGDFFIHPTSKKPFNTILMYYLVGKIGGEINVENFDESEKNYIKEAQWVDISSIKGLKFYNPIDNVELIRKAQKSLTTNP